MLKVATPGIPVPTFIDWMFTLKGDPDVAVIFRFPETLSVS